MMNHRSLPHSPSTLPDTITKSASRQTYYTIRLLADRERAGDALRAYAYFRWVDDTLDTPGAAQHERQEFLARQQELLRRCYQRDIPTDASAHERMLVELVHRDPDPTSGLSVYLHNMMAVMRFDTERRGRQITGSQLQEYTHHLASAVTECMHYFIGRRCASPHDETRYLAVSAAHVTHMLRDTIDDVQAGYYNVPCEVLEASSIGPEDIKADAYRAWVKARVELARQYFEKGRTYLQRVQNPRCRVAGLAYVARFEGVLDSIEKEGYILRAEYPERKGLMGIARACLSMTGGFLDRHRDYLSASQVPANERSLNSL